MFVKHPKKTASAPLALKHLPSDPAEEGIDTAPNEMSVMQSPDTPAAQTKPQSDEEAQQIATSRALATAKAILQKGGTQAEAAEGAKAVARQILREFQFSKEVVEVQGEVQVDEIISASMVSNALQFNPPSDNISAHLFSRRSSRRRQNQWTGRAK